jgi:hypothetical protein
MLSTDRDRRQSSSAIGKGSILVLAHQNASWLCQSKLWGRVRPC